jgi:uncharacterized membrane protein YcaP (DUF421 family)
VDIPDFGSDLIGIVIRTTIVYAALVLGFRLIGKSRTGQLSTIDLIVLLVISNAVQNAMVGENVTLIGGLVAAAVILVADRALHFLTERSSSLRRAVEGEPTILVEDGRILEDRLDHEGVTRAELAMALRQNGLLRAEEARFVYLETTGAISVIPYRDEPSAGASDGPPGNRRDREPKTPD